MRRSFALRLAAAFAGVGIAAAAITAILVNLSFGTRFTAYLEDQQRARQQQLVSDLARSYEENGGWTVGNLRSMQSLALMDGGTMVLLDANGHVVWNGPAGAGGRSARSPATDPRSRAGLGRRNRADSSPPGRCTPAGRGLPIGRQPVVAPRGPGRGGHRPGARSRARAQGDRSGP